MNKRPIYQVIASAMVARKNCEKTGNQEWFARHLDTIEALTKEHAPSGSGFDSGTKFDPDASTGEKLVFRTSFHHMDEHGYYDGWTDHCIIVRPSLAYGFTLHIGGKDRNGIKDYMHEVFAHFLSLEV